MKHIKYFESNGEILNKGWKGVNIGKVENEDIIYQYVQQLHRDNNDFIDGDLGERIEKYRRYQLREVNLSEVDLDEWDVDMDIVDDYIEMFQIDQDYPPIVLDNGYPLDYSIIDGIHRANALSKMGIKKIKAWIGIR